MLDVRNNGLPAITLMFPTETKNNIQCLGLKPRFIKIKKTSYELNYDPT